MGGAIADSVTHSQTFDTDVRSLETKLGPSHRKAHTLSDYSGYEKPTPFSPLSVQPYPPTKQKAWDFCMYSEAFFFPANYFFGVVSTTTR